MKVKVYQKGSKEREAILKVISVIKDIKDRMSESIAFFEQKRALYEADKKNTESAIKNLKAIGKVPFELLDLNTYANACAFRIRGINALLPECKSLIDDLNKSLKIFVRLKSLLENILEENIEEAFNKIDTELKNFTTVLETIQIREQKMIKIIADYALSETYTGPLNYARTAIKVIPFFQEVFVGSLRSLKEYLKNL